MSYQQTLTDLAYNIVRDCDSEDKYADRVHEDVDSHLVYMSAAFEVLDKSRNCDAYFEDFGNLDASSYSEAITKMAYAAMSRDLFEVIEEVKEEVLAEKEAERKYTYTVFDCDANGDAAPGQSWPDYQDQEIEADSVSDAFDEIEADIPVPEDGDAIIHLWDHEGVLHTRKIVAET